jgi:ferrous iron transport protein B
LNEQINVALIGNPNTGKSSIFNLLTGLNQKVGNFPGVTVDKKTGFASLSAESRALIIDLPGTYSLYPRSKDETIAIEILSKPDNKYYPDILVVVADASNLKRNLLLFTQVADLHIPVVLALNMMDTAARAGVSIDTALLSEKLGIPVVPMNAREGQGEEELKKAILQQTALRKTTEPSIDIHSIAPGIIDEIRSHFGLENDYVAFQLAHHYGELNYLSKEDKAFIAALGTRYEFNSQKIQAGETIARYNYINDLLFDCVKKDYAPSAESYSNRIDRVLTHKIFGFAIFFLILFLVFQSIFACSSYPMELIEQGFGWLEDQLTALLPAGVLTDLLIGGSSRD